MAGFQVWDIVMEDIVKEKVTLDRFRGIIFPGGFSYADVLGSAKGWAASFLFHPYAKAQLDHFYKRDNTFSLGVCNGCQLLALLQWVGNTNPRLVGTKTEVGNIPVAPETFLDHNGSERYESRFPSVRIEKTSSIMLKGMAGSVLGVWIAHAEGRFEYQSPTILANLEKQNCVALRYVDDNNKETEEYPMNPNGSKNGVAGLVSQDGRHLAMMPHPERCVLPWQWPWMPSEFKEKLGDASPWLQMFINAYNWCIQNS